MPGERGAGACLLSGWCCSFRGRLRSFLGTVTRPQVAGLGYPQRPERPDSLRGDRLGGQADMVAALVKQRYAAYRQPMGALPEHRRAAGPGIHRKAGELVDDSQGGRTCEECCNWVSSALPGASC